MRLKSTILSAAIGAMLALGACNSTDFGNRGNALPTPEGQLNVTLRNDGGGTATVDDRYVASPNREIVISNLEAGDVLTLSAKANPIGTVFSSWTVIGGGVVESPFSETTTLTMPAGNVIVRANFVGTTDDVLQSVVDPNTKTALVALMASEGWDTDGDGKLSITEAAAVKDIDLSNQSLNGGVDGQLDGVIGYFTALETLDLSGNANIIGFDLSKNPNLKELVASGTSPNRTMQTPNQTPIIDLAWNTNLVVLDMSNTGRFLYRLLLPRTSTLETLAVTAGNDSYGYANTNGNLKQLDMSGLTGLKTLTIAGYSTANDLVFPKTATLETLDISMGAADASPGANAALGYLGLEGLTGLQSLSITRHNALATIKLPATVTLKTVNIVPSAISRALSTIDFSMLTGVETITMEQFGATTDIKFPATATLKTINMKVTLNMNQTLKFVDISMLPALQSLDMSGYYQLYTATSTDAHIRASEALEPDVATVIKLGPVATPTLHVTNTSIMEYVTVD